MRTLDDGKIVIQGFFLRLPGFKASCREVVRADDDSYLLKRMGTVVKRKIKMDTVVMKDVMV